MRDVHLTRQELTAWRDEAAGDRSRIVTHLAACPACRSIAADVERSRPALEGPGRFDAADFVERGYRSERPEVVQSRVRRWFWLAAPAALAASVLVPLWLARSDDPTGTLRGGSSGVVLVRPVDGTVRLDELTFEWKGTSPDDRVRLNVIDLQQPGEPLIEREVGGSRYQPTPDERRRFRSGQLLHWYVEVQGRGGAAPSAAARFRLQ